MLTLGEAGEWYVGTLLLLELFYKHKIISKLKILEAHSSELQVLNVEGTRGIANHHEANTALIVAGKIH